MQTLSTYTTMVQAEVDDASSGSRVVIQNSIKEIYQEILRDVAKFLVGTDTQTKTATAGVRTYTPDTDFIEIMAVHYKGAGESDYSKLEEMSQEDYLNYNVNDDNGTPTNYFINGLKIELNKPCEDAGTIRIEYVAVPEDVDTSSLIPDRYNNVVKLGACYKFFAYEKGAESTEYYSWYQLAKRDMINELSTRVKQITPKLWGR